MTKVTGKELEKESFQLTSSQGGWLLIYVSCQLPPVFQLTSSQGGWHFWISFYPIQLHFFNSHPHKEDDLLHVCQCYVLSLFNSHPHKEDDYIFLARLPFLHFSTHILTRRMTHPLPIFWDRNKIFNSHPHKEDDICTYPVFAEVVVFQLTSSQGGWRYFFTHF